MPSPTSKKNRQTDDDAAAVTEVTTPATQNPEKPEQAIRRIFDQLASQGVSRVTVQFAACAPLDPPLEAVIHLSGSAVDAVAPKLSVAQINAEDAREKALKSMLEKSIRYDQSFADAREDLDTAESAFNCIPGSAEGTLLGETTKAAYLSAYDNYIAAIDHYVHRSMLELLHFDAENKAA